MELTVGVLGRASGIRGEIRVSMQTDEPELRFAAGTVLQTNHPQFPELTVHRAHQSGKHFVVGFTEITDRNLAETLSGTVLLIDTADENPRRGIAVETDTASAREEGFYRHELLGLTAVHEDGTQLGTVSDLLLGTAQDILEVTTAAREKILVPFVYEIVPVVDLEGNRVVLTPPPGLFNPSQAEEAH